MQAEAVQAAISTDGRHPDVQTAARELALLVEDCINQHLATHPSQLPGKPSLSALSASSSLPIRLLGSSYGSLSLDWAMLH